jgi:hypothetical protein
MPRKLRPCGTRAAYQRHLYNKEEPCEACKAANVVRAMSAPSGGGKKAREIDVSNRYVADGDLALRLNPPRITWRRKPNGIWVHTSINDPHAEGPSRRATRAYGQKRSSVFPVACVNGHEFDSWNTMVSADGMPHCRTCASPQDTQLLSAARTDI